MISYKEAAEALGLPYFKIQRAAARGLIPTYSLLNGRKYVKLRDIEARIQTQN
jgi:excisionase family DNA binding protein